MENYIGSKIIKAELTTLDKYKKKKYGDNAKIEENDKNIECYIVIYPPIGDNESVPYISMSPKSIFETAYRKVKDCEISLLLTEDENE